MAKRELVLWAAVGAYVAAFSFAVVWAQWWTVRQPEPFTPVNVEAWLKPGPGVDGPRIESFEVPPTAAGLERAVQMQWAIVSTLDSLGRSVWGSYDCWLLISGDRDRSALEVKDIKIEMVGRTTANVSLRLGRRAGGRFVFIKAPSEERWEYRDGAWVNQTCSYYDGPSFIDLIDGSIEVIGDAPESP